MSAHDNSGPAFPTAQQVDRNGYIEVAASEGATLRAIFAGQAMAAILSNHTMVDSFGGATYAWIADHACGVADALLARLDQ